MSWNWQHEGWPNFVWAQDRLARAESKFLHTGGVFLGSIRHLDEGDSEHLTVEAMCLEALTTSEIEGEILDRDSVQSSIRRQLGFSTDGRRINPAEHGIAEMMVSLYRTAEAPLTHETLCDWHRMITNGRRDLLDVGRYRRSANAMQIVSGRLDRPNVHFEAPPADRVPAEMDRFLDWFHRTGPAGASPLPAITRAGIAHLYFESIHPFEDGNGRIGRAIVEKSISQTTKQPAFIAIAASILARRKEYYGALEAVNKKIEISDWLAWFAGIAIEAEHRSLALAEFLIDKAKYLDRFRGELNPRQEKALLRMLAEGPQGFTGGMTAGKFGSITGGSPSTTTRDLAELAALGALVRTGEHRGARYHLPIQPRPIRRVTISPEGEVLDA